MFENEIKWIDVSWEHVSFNGENYCNAKNELLVNVMNNVFLFI